MMKRRDFAKTLAVVPGLSVAGCTGASEKLHVSEQPEKKQYGVQYYEKACDIWEQESTSELPLIAEAADRAVHTLRNGKKLYSHVIFGHMLTAEFRADRAGNPNYLPNWDRNATDEVYNAIGEGDFLFFDYAHPRVRKARDRGAFTVGIRVPYIPNETIPAGVLFPEYRLYWDIKTEECASSVLTPGVPFTDGVLNVLEIPAVRACPISVQGAGIFYWMLTAGIAARDKGKGSTQQESTEKALEYIECIKERGARIRADIDHLDAAANAMAECVAQGGRYWNYTHGCEWEIENYIRASGLAMSRLLKPEDIHDKAAPGDFAIIAGEFSDIQENHSMAEALKSKGLTVFSIGSTHTDGSNGNDISKVADWHIETYSPERDGVVTIPGFDKKICPVTGNLFVLALWMLNSQFIARMIDRGMVPGLDMGVHLMGGRGYNSAVRPVVAKRGY